MKLVATCVSLIVVSMAGSISAQPINDPTDLDLDGLADLRTEGVKN